MDLVSSIVTVLGAYIKAYIIMYAINYMFRLIGGYFHVPTLLVVIGLGFSIVAICWLILRLRGTYDKSS